VYVCERARYVVLSDDGSLFVSDNILPDTSI
jgi:hypothetical protein